MMQSRGSMGSSEQRVHWDGELRRAPERNRLQEVQAVLSEARAVQHSKASSSENAYLLGQSERKEE